MKKIQKCQKSRIIENRKYSYTIKKKLYIKKAQFSIEDEDDLIFQKLEVNKCDG